MTPGSGDYQVLTSDGSSVEKSYSGPVMIFVGNNFGGGTVNVELRNPEGGIVTLQPQLSANFEIFLPFPENASNSIRLTLAGSTNPNLEVWIQGSF